MTEIKNKSEFVRGVLRQIGALSETPPDGWRLKVEDALAKQKVEMHQVMIYQIRRKEMEKMVKSEHKPEPLAKINADGQKPTLKRGPKPKSKQMDALSITDLLKARKVAIDFGGVEKLLGALNALSTLLGNVSTI